MGYSRRASNYPKIITLSDLTCMMRMRNLVAITMKILMIDNRCSFEKYVIKLIRMNPLIILYLTVDQVN